MNMTVYGRLFKCHPLARNTKIEKKTWQTNTLGATFHLFVSATKSLQANYIMLILAKIPDESDQEYPNN
jgi:hypothetical protein